MKKLIFTLTLTVISSVCVFAQSSDDYKKFEIFVGYSYQQVDTDFDANPAVDIYRRRANYDGFNASGVYNVSRYFGVKGDVSGSYNNHQFGFTVPTTGGTTALVAFEAKNSLYNFLGGVQIKDNASKGRFKPFAHAMIGAAFRRNKIEPMACITIIPCPISTSDNGLAGAFGGGLDIRVNNKFAVRAFQIDYNPAWFNNGTANNMRFGVGLVF